MFNSISGIVTAKLPNSIYLEGNGIEWDFMVPALSLEAFGPVGSEARVFTWLYHREDQMRLFGFSSVRERDIFIDLMKVEGIGPKQAIKILSSISADDLEKALDGEDLARLESAPGIGKKTAQKMILALKGKLTREIAQGAARPKGEHEDVVAALVGMGYDRKVATGVVADIFRELETEGQKRSPADAEKELFRRAIVALSS